MTRPVFAILQGGLVYGYYGRNEDFETLKKHNVPVQGNIVILRVGRISFAEKVASAEQYGATGVLIYLDPSDYQQGFRQQDFYSNSCLSGHVSTHQ
ncbi:transferrin receptor protein 2-like [Chiloscyllium plagiosum]|uniref:transferrin receptor protein 2-like n=1 Tax=Chiloscyllium plagiosum TaxID=36176 RepID=UPI001CB7E7AE|nr:transferrin receptor protein 2-like [Chiloscyllium plagiosum]